MAMVGGQRRGEEGPRYCNYIDMRAGAAMFQQGCNCLGLPVGPPPGIACCPLNSKTLLRQWIVLTTGGKRSKLAIARKLTGRSTT